MPEYGVRNTDKMIEKGWEEIPFSPFFGHRGKQKNGNSSPISYKNAGKAPNSGDFRTLSLTRGLFFDILLNDNE